MRIRDKSPRCARKPGPSRPPPSRSSPVTLKPCPTVSNCPPCRPIGRPRPCPCHISCKKIGCRPPSSCAYTRPASDKFLSSSAVEQSAVNRSVVGSIPTSGATLSISDSQRLAHQIEGFGAPTVSESVSGEARSSTIRANSALTRSLLITADGAFRCFFTADETTMQNPYRIFQRRGGVFYIEEVATKKQHSLRTRSRSEAQQLLAVKNVAAQNPLLNRAMAKTFLAAHNPKMLERTWSEVFKAFASRGRESSQERSRRAAASRSFDLIRDKVIIETEAEDLLAVLQGGGAATNNYLRRFHNHALNLGWLLGPILPPKAWPSLPATRRAGITRGQFEAIVAAEKNAERCAYYRLLWETGAAQTDAAMLTAENIDWANHVLIYSRKKLRSDSAPCRLKIGPTLEALLHTLPRTGALFPVIAREDAGRRSSEFRRRCKILRITGISLHSFRYGWAERAYANGYPERFAQAALGHASKAVHRAYARSAKVECPPLETWEPSMSKIVPFEAPAGNDLTETATDVNDPASQAS